MGGRNGEILDIVSNFGQRPSNSRKIEIPKEQVIILDGDHAALKAATRDLCGKEVALIGEAPTHGDGHTEAFKVALVRQLVSRCHFNAIVFESGRYEFIAYQRALRQGDANPAMIADAVGGIWKYDREFQPLVDFLHAEAKAARVRLAGMDAQLGGLGETFANERMVPELTRSLPSAQASSCNAAFARHIEWNYPADHPYDRDEHDRLLACAAAMRRALDADMAIDQTTRAERTAMIENIAWWISPDMDSRPEKSAARERWMFRNVLSIASALPRRSKIIVWGATVHLGRNVTSTLSVEPHQTLGEMLHDRYPGKAFTLGFSARRGSYRVFRDRLTIQPPPPASLERRASKDGNQTAVYLNKRPLARMGILAGGALEHSYHAANWADVVDGMVIFDEEWPTHSNRKGYS